MRSLGLDLGGTNIKVAVLEWGDAHEVDVATVVTTESGTTEAAGGPGAVAARLVEIGLSVMDKHGPVARVGLGVPGLFDGTSGCIELFPNLPGPWRGYPLLARVADGLALPTRIINDARAFTLAETRLGAARGCSTIVNVVLGTGIGGGVVVDGRLRFGPHGRAGELGHQIVVRDGPACGCGNRGCVEAVAGSAALAVLGGRANPAEVADAAREGDPRAVAAIHEVAGYLADALANLVTVLIPERIVVGGGIADAGELLLDPLRAALRQRAVLIPADWYDVVPAQLGTSAGAIGAALWAVEAD